MPLENYADDLHAAFADWINYPAPYYLLEGVLNPANDLRSLDVGESGQFAPGGRYNELGATKPRRVDLDGQVDSAVSGEEK